MKPSRLKRNRERVRAYEARRFASVPIGIICERLHVCPEAVRRAAKIHNVPLVGMLLATGPARLTLDFLETAQEEHEALEAAEARRARMGSA